MSDKRPDKKQPISRRQSRLDVARRVRAATGLVLIAMMTALGVSFHKFALDRSPYTTEVIILGGLIGFVLLSLERSARSRRRNELVTLRFYQSSQFYGMTLVPATAMVLVYALFFAPDPTVRARSHSAASALFAPAFPILVVSGVILTGRNSSAFINSQPVMVGENTSGVLLVSVTEKEIVVELDGFQKTIPVTQTSPAVAASSGL